MANIRNSATFSPQRRGEEPTVSPLAEIVLRTLRRQIVDGELSSGVPLPSERTLADRHSVSRTVIREATSALAAEGLLLQSDRCRPIVARPSGRVRRGAPRLGVWLWPHAEDTFASAIVRGVQRAARGTDARLVIGAAPHASWEDDVEAEARFIRELGDDGADGAILWYLGGSRNLPALRDARARGVEFVFVDRKPPRGFEADFVGTENVGAARNAVAHLVELGHRRIAFVGNLDTVSTVLDRQEGYHRALDDAGLEPGPELTFAPDEGEPDAVAIRRVAIDLMAQRPTGIFAVNDGVALLLIEALRDLGASVPGDFSVVGFDGLLHWVPGGGPLTTAKQNFSTLGEIAGDALIARLSPDSPSTYRHVLLDAPLSFGSSTAPYRTSPDPLPSIG